MEKSDHPYADFRNFVWAVWAHLNLPEPTALQYDIAKYLQKGPKRSIIAAFRGCAKSFLTSAYVVWSLYWNPDFRVMVVSASKERADAFSQFCLKLIQEMPELKHMAPRVDQRRSLVAFDINGATTDHSPSVKSVGITGQLTGSRADLIVADDVESPRNSQTQLQREKLRELVKEFDAVLKPLDHARVIYLGTPQCEDSLYNDLATRGYEMRIWPALKPTPVEAAKYLGRLAPFIEHLEVDYGRSVEPKRFSDKDLAERQASYGRSGFALQFLLDTTLSDANRFPLKCSDFIVMDVDPHIGPVALTYGSGQEQLLAEDCVGLRGDRWYGPMYTSKDFAEFTGSVMYVDPSGRGSDRTGVAVVKMLNGTLFIRRLVGFDGGYDEKTMSAIAHLAKLEKVNLIQVESNFGDGMFTQLLKPYLTRIHPCTVEDIRVSKQKELRIIDTLEPVLNQHRLVLDRSIIRGDMAAEPKHQVFWQLTRITKDKGALAHDDLLDALAGAVAYWVERLGVDQSTAEEDHAKRLIEEEILRMMDGPNAYGVTLNRPPSFIERV